jgi:hypothetical protein
VAVIDAMDIAESVLRHACVGGAAAISAEMDAVVGRCFVAADRAPADGEGERFRVPDDGAGDVYRSKGAKIR